MKLSANRIFLCTSLLCTSLMSYAEIRDPEGPSEPVTIKKIQTNGSGCPIGTVASNIADDNQSFTLTFSEFVAETGPGLSLSKARKNCILTMVLDVPPGWQYSIATFYFRGFMQLDEGIEAEHSVDYFFEGQGVTGRFGDKESGPFAEDYVYQDDIGIDSAVWSPCQQTRALNINQKIRVWNKNPSQYKNAAGLIANDSTDGIIKQIWGLTWKRCD